MNGFEEVVSMPVSPFGYYFSSSALNVFVLGVLESEIPIDDSIAVPLLKDVFIPIHPRLSSVMIVDINEKKQWKQVDVSLTEHIKIPIFPANTSVKLYDDYLDEYMSIIAKEQLPQDKPLWEMHMIKYPTSKAAGTFIFKLHHALGDGYSLMAALLSCVQRADDPSLPLQFPSSRRVESKSNNKTMLIRLPQIISNIFMGILDFGWSILKDSMIEDDQTPVRSGKKDLGSRPIAISNVSVSLESIKEVKNKLSVSTNDVLVGIIFLSIRLYMKVMNHKSGRMHTTARVLLNTRNIKAYKSTKDMVDTKAKAPWGNRISFLHVPIPELSDTSSSSNPLKFVCEAKKIIKRKRYSLAVPLNKVLLNLVRKFGGSEAAARYMHKSLKNSSLSISHMVGPMEQIALANHPIKGLYFMTIGLQQSVTVTITSYMGYLRVGFGVEKDFIDEHQFKSCFEKSLEMMLSAARNYIAPN